MPLSIRWRLPFSYAAVALLAVITLGGVLLFALDRYFRQEEFLYLSRNAQTMGEMAEQLLNSDSDSESRLEIVQATLDTYAFLSQTEVAYRDVAGETFLTSGNPRDLQAVATFSLAVSVDGQQQTIGQRLDAVSSSSFVILERPGRRFESQSTQTPGYDRTGLALPAGWTAVNADTARSDLVLTYPLFDPGGEKLGQLVLSNGPAFGQRVLRTVAIALSVSAAVATLLAATVGWWASRRLTEPIGALAHTAQRMAGGDFAARSAVHRNDEIGTLATSFNAMADRVAGTVETLRDFVADAAHEIHTPLTALQTELELALGLAGAAEAIRGPVVAAQRQADRMVRLTDGLLDLSQLEAEAMSWDDRPVDLAQLVQDRSESAAARAEQKGVDFRLGLPDSAARIAGNARNLGRAFDNLLDNAVKFTLPGGEVSVALAVDRSAALVTIRDTGIGIEPEERERLFRRFRRGRNAGDFAGSGLGLAIAHNVIVAHGGTIALEPSADGVAGTVVSIRLPRDGRATDTS